MAHGSLAQYAGVFAAVFFVSSAQADKKPATEPAVVRNAQDEDLKWGAGPAFMPKGTEMTVLHGDPAKKNADVLLRIPAKGVVPEHWHTSAERMVLISGELHVTYTGQEKTVLKGGTYGYGPPKAPHGAVCVSEEPCVLFIAFESAVDAVPVAKPTK